MTKLSQEKQLHEDAVNVCGTITNFIMDNMLESMVRANIPDKDILKAVAQTKTGVQLLHLFSPNTLSKDMVNESATRFDCYGQTCLDFWHEEIEQEKEAA